MATVTLVGQRLAEEGSEFVYLGESSLCEGCPYREQCLNLEPDVRYRVTGVRDSGTLECAVHDTGVTAVEVEPAPVRANVDASGAYAGSTVSLEGPCPHTDCPSHEYCEPAGAAFGERHRISEVLGDPPHDYCALDRDLTLVEFAPPESESGSEPGSE
jgi:uncharacterized protein (UPF0179 family)